MEFEITDLLSKKNNTTTENAWDWSTEVGNQNRLDGTADKKLDFLQSQTVHPNLYSQNRSEFPSGLISPSPSAAEEMSGPDDSVLKDWGGAGFGRHVNLDPKMRLRLVEGQFLGKGRNEVVETTCYETRLAWKTMKFPKNVEEIDRKEIEILKKLHHRHIIVLAGSYSHGRTLGILLWPVAPFSLGTFFKHLDTVNLHVSTEKLDCSLDVSALPDEPYSAAENLARLVFNDYESRRPSIGAIIDASLRRLCGSIGCLASAVTYIHGQRVRHKDLKPSNILIFPDGIRLADFDISNDFSKLTISKTEGGSGTERYFAPEVALREKCGRASDIFSLGCIFLEMMALATIECFLKQRDQSWSASLQSYCPLQKLLDMRPRFPNPYWPYVDEQHKWLAAVRTPAPANRHLLRMIEQMLSKNADLRPKAVQLVMRLALIEQLRKNYSCSEEAFPPLHGVCCEPAILMPDDVGIVEELFPVDPSTVTSPQQAASSVATIRDVLWNKKGQRVDRTPRPYNKYEVNNVKQLNLCHKHHLLRDCPFGDGCQHSHSYTPSHSELQTLRLVWRQQKCIRGSSCDEPTCIYGHQCHNGRPGGSPTKTEDCAYGGPSPGGKCSFPAEMHDMNLDVAKISKANLEMPF